ncbi:ABC transporter substrate-binding protein [Paenibacillaceae bacterium]|nr:ABC transporter substrate-binding protein [Paenibacillaceae bacterium]
MESPYFEGLLEGIEEIGKSAVDISFEKIMDMEPDLIIVMTSDEDEYNNYRKIASTVAIPYGSLGNPQNEVSYFGELLGREQEAKVWIADYEARIAVAKAKVEQAIPADATFAVMSEDGKNVSVFGNDFGRGGHSIYQIFERKIPEKYGAKVIEERYRVLSREVLPEYAGDYIVLTTDKSLEEYEADVIWGTLDAVKNGRMYVWPNKKSYFIDPLSLLSQTEELAEWLAGLKS